jgi:hypothetical protein
MVDRNKNYLIIFLITIFISCNSTKTDNNRLTENWKKDSLGCMNIRNKQYSDLINKRITFKNMPESFLIKYLGKSNKIENDDNYRYYIYYFNTQCVNNRIIDTVEKCYLQYRINLKTLNIVDYKNICQ